MKLFEFTYYPEPIEQFGTRVAVNPEYVSCVARWDEEWVAISIEGNRPVYAHMTYSRAVAELQLLKD